MKSILLAAAVFALSSGVALAAGGGGGGGADIGNNTSTSMGAPSGSPSYSAPRSGAVPGLPAQASHTQQANQGQMKQAYKEKGVIRQAPRNPVTGHAQTAPQ